MAAPKILQILEALRDRLYAIKSADGYNTDPQIVFGAQALSQDALNAGPVVSIYDQGDTPTGELTLCTERQIAADVMVEGLVSINEANPTETALLLWQDIIRAVHASDTTLGGLVSSIERETRDIEYPQTGVDAVAIRQALTVTYIETYGNP